MGNLYALNVCTTFSEICLGITYLLYATSMVGGKCDPIRESCIEPVTINDATGNQANVSDEGCSESIVCKHGFCALQNDTGIHCVCDVGWGGRNCNESKKQCTLNCSIGEICVLVNNGQETCLPVQTSTTGVARVDHAQRETDVCNDSHYEHPVSSECDLQCVYGVCKETDSGNMYCHCDPGATGDSCENKCCLDCNSHGECEPGTDGDKPSCNCWVNYTGYHCEQFIRVTTLAPGVVFKESPWYPWVVAVVVLVVLLLLLVVLLYFMWKRRMLLGLKIVHFFQKYEDDDDRQWDAFVSYKSGTRDELFVVQTLIPKLEEELGFNLHLHSRDFIPGDTIANNIVRAVLGSRRTILVVSPEFAQAEWTRFEYHIAQQEMLKRKHRIIPIVLEKITEDVDPILNTILKAVTYLEWPTSESPKEVDKFWKRLELSMPKKRDVVPGHENGIDSVAFDTSRTDAIDISIDIDRGQTYVDDGIRNNHVEPDIMTGTNNLNDARNIAKNDKYGENNSAYS